MENTIPKVIIKEAKELIQLYGENFVKIGSESVRDIYMFEFPENSLIGYPVLYVHNTEDDTVTMIRNFEALDMIEKYIK